MGKRARKTRWRALDIADEHSDSEESNTNSSAVSSRNSRSYSNGFYSKYPYSSQSTPARRRHIQYDGSAKSTRSSSTTSENKITFNEDEYTRITTPRQDVLFKKGYLNKPKNYHTQTSTGNSTISTGNSTENGTPDHQSTDLDYESQFMFPNGFVDQNGIYYVNSYEPYPLMLFNPPTYYQECSNVKSKRMSTGSLSESMSPNNEEATSQDLSPSGGDASNSVSDYSGGQPMYNMVTYGYYLNGACTPTDLTNGHHSPAEPVKKLKKRRERKSSKNIQDDSSEYTDENSCDETPEAIPDNSVSSGAMSPSENNADPASRLQASASVDLQKTQNVSPYEAQIGNSKEEELKTVCENSGTLSKGCADSKTEINDDKSEFDQAQPSTGCTKLSVLKPDAEEFIPRAYQNLGPPPHIKMLPPNFMPIPLVPINDFAGQSFAPHPAFIHSGIPINFIHHHPGPKMFPAAPGFVNLVPPIIPETKIEDISDQNEDIASEEKESTATPQHTPVLEESKPVVHNKTIDIATVVSKLEAVKQQENEVHSSHTETASCVVNETKPFIGSPRFKKSTTFKRNYYNRYRCSPVRSGNKNYPYQNVNCSTSFERSLQNDKTFPAFNSSIFPQKQLNGESLQYINEPVQHAELPQSEKNGSPVTSEHPNSLAQQVNLSSNVPNENASQKHRESPVRVGVTQVVQNARVNEQLLENGTKYSEANSVKIHFTNDTRVRSSPDRFNKNWKPNGYQNSGQYGYSSPKRSHHQNTQHQKTVDYEIGKTNTNGDLSPTLNKIYSETLKKAQIISGSSSPQYKKHINTEKSIKTAENIVDVSNKIDIQPKSNQWISVSNKKKKKYKNIEETDINVNQDVVGEPAQTDASSDFESYDVNQLVDVVPSLTLEPNVKNEQNFEDILTIIAKNESSEILVNRTENPTNIIIPEVSDIEKEIIIKIEEQEKILIDKTLRDAKDAGTQMIQPKENNVIMDREIVPLISDEQKEENFKPKKKSKKGTQKPLTRKIIITDIDLSMAYEVKSPAKKVNTETKSNDLDKLQLEQPVPVFTEVSVKESEPEALLVQTEKKPKKKKKNKTSKSIQIDSVTNTNVTTTDESYDIFLETSLESASPDKTNDDISLELEKLIQKGMFNSLHEKIKSINVEPEADGFFKSFQAVSSLGKEKTPSANGFMKAPDFNRIFQSTRQFLKPNMVSVEQDISDSNVAIDDNKDTKSSSSTPDAADPSAGLFLDNSQEIQEAPTEVATDSIAPAQKNEHQEDSKKLYPITQAVKEWMSKTREATPEVEILKSPTTIQKEFADIDSSSYGLNDALDSEDEDEVILFSNEAVEQDDLLDYWENDLTSPETTIKDCKEFKDCSEIPKICSDSNCCIKCQTTFINEGEEKIQVYESKYGQNDAFLKLHRKLKESQPNSSRSENFPSRTICCCLQ